MKPRSAIKTDLFAFDHHRKKIDTLGDPLAEIESHIDFGALAAEVATKRRVRLNRAVVSKAHQLVRPGDILTFPQGDRIRVVRVLGLGLRRGPAVAMASVSSAADDRRADWPSSANRSTYAARSPWLWKR